MIFSCQGGEDPVEQLYQCLMLSSVTLLGKEMGWEKFGIDFIRTHHNSWCVFVRRV